MREKTAVMHSVIEPIVVVACGAVIAQRRRTARGRAHARPRSSLRAGVGRRSNRAADGGRPLRHLTEDSP